MEKATTGDMDSIRDQLAQPGLSPFRRAELALALRPYLASGALSLPTGERHKTAYTLGKLVGLGESVMLKADSLMAHASDEVKADLRAGAVTITAAYDHMKNGKPTKPAKPAKVVGDPETVTHWMDLIDAVADGVCRTDAEIEKLTGFKRCRRFLEKVQLIPWLTITRSSAGVTLIINQELRAICEWHATSTKLGDEPDDTKPSIPATLGMSVRDFVRMIRDHVSTVRKENNDLYRMRMWRSVQINNRVQSSLLDWIEAELGRIP